MDIECDKNPIVLLFPSIHSFLQVSFYNVSANNKGEVLTGDDNP